MKYLKTYEDNNISHNKPMEGDFVIIKSWSTDIDTATFLNNTIGQIERIIGNDITVKYDTDMLKKANLIFINNMMIFHKSQIKYWAQTKEELEIKINSNKYNL